MTKAVLPLAEPAIVTVTDEAVQKIIKLMKLANPNAQKSCAMCATAGSSNISWQDAFQNTGQNYHWRQYSLSGLTTSFSHLQITSPMPSLTVVDPNPQTGYFSIPTIHTSWARICPGIVVSWLPGSVWGSYPYHQHAEQAIGWMPIAFDSMANKIFLHSDKCVIQLFEQDKAPCTCCLLVKHSVEFKSFISRATEAKEHTLWNFLTGEQLLGLLKKMAGQLKTLHTKVC